LQHLTQAFLERRVSVPHDAPQKLVDDIETYSAWVEMQSRMTGSASWYQKLA